MFVHTKLIDNVVQHFSLYGDLNISLDLVNSYNFCSDIYKPRRSNQ